MSEDDDSPITMRQLHRAMDLVAGLYEAGESYSDALNILGIAAGLLMSQGEDKEGSVAGLREQYGKAMRHGRAVT
jgi:hypothetical protein